MKKPTLILLVGIPGSGKTSYAEEYIKKHRNTVHLSSDAIRKELYGNENIQGNPEEVFALLQKRTIECLKNGKDVVYDATNVTRKNRASIINICPKYVKIECYIIWASIEECIKRDAKRERTVGKEVIDKMLKRFQAPFYDEGINEIVIIKPDGWDWEAENYTQECYQNMKTPHNNPHHTLNVLDHCWEAYQYLWDKNITDDELLNATLAHDIGKPYVKAFVDSKGNPCNVAHYYQHQCVGAYMSYGFGATTPYSAWLVSTHMDPFLNTKYYDKLPPFLKKDVDLLHEADLNAH